jgi:hypothetical protein
LANLLELFELRVFWRALAKNLHSTDDSLIGIPQRGRTNEYRQMPPVLVVKIELSLPGLAICDRMLRWTLAFGKAHPILACVLQDVVTTASSQDLGACISRDTLSAAVPIADIASQIQNVDPLFEIVQDFLVKSVS